MSKKEERAETLRERLILAGIRVIEEDGSDAHLTRLGEYEDAAVLHRVPAQRSVVTPSVRKLAEGTQGYIDIDADGMQEKISYALYRDLKVMGGASPNQIKPIHVITEGRLKRFFFGLLQK